MGFALSCSGLICLKLDTDTYVSWGIFILAVVLHALQACCGVLLMVLAEATKDEAQP